ncbi:hypothetical protein OROMI_034045 [Orobanche minor]
MERLCTSQCVVSDAAPSNSYSKCFSSDHERWNGCALLNVQFVMQPLRFLIPDASVLIDWNIEVRCCRKWYITEHGDVSASMEIVLVDRDGNRTQATVKGHIIDRFDNLIQERLLLKIQQFSVVDRPKIFPAAYHPYKIVFQKNTYLGPTVSTRFPKTLFSFRSFSDIKNGSFKYEAPMFDIIGKTAPARTRASQEEVEAHEKWVKDDIRVRGYMLGSMTNELQRAHEKMTSSRAILAHLAELYGEHSRTARYEISKQLFGARMKEGEKVGDHVLKMISMIERFSSGSFCSLQR